MTYLWGIAIWAHHYFSLVNVNLLFIITPPKCYYQRMSTANIKLKSSKISELKSVTGENTGQKATEVAIEEYLKYKRNLNLFDNLQKVKFKSGFEPQKLRNRDR